MSAALRLKEGRRLGGCVGKICDLMSGASDIIDFQVRNIRVDRMDGLPDTGGDR